MSEERDAILVLMGYEVHLQGIPTLITVEDVRRARAEVESLHAELASERAANAKLRDALTEIATFPRRRMPADIANEALSGEAVPVQQPQP